MTTYIKSSALTGFALLVSLVFCLAFLSVSGCETKKTADKEEPPAVKGTPGDEEQPVETAPTNPAAPEQKEPARTPGVIDDRLVPTDEMKGHDTEGTPVLQAQADEDEAKDEAPDEEKVGSGEEGAEEPAPEAAE